MRSTFASAAAILVATITACSSSSSNESIGQKTGRVTCTFGHVCPPGQYCDPLYSPANADRRTPCNPGCLAEENCAGDQKCVICSLEKDKYDQNSGACRPPTETKESVCAKPDASASTCHRDSMFDRDCGSGQAFVCDTSEQPKDTTCKNPGTLPGLWCCGGGTPTNPCQRDNSRDMICSSAAGKRFYQCPIDKDPPKTCAAAGMPSGYCCPD